MWSDFDVLDENGDVVHASDVEIDKGLPVTVSIYDNDYPLYCEYIIKNYDYWFILENQYIWSTSGAGNIGQRINIYGSNDREMLLNIYDSANPNSNNGNSGNFSVKLANNPSNYYTLDEYTYEYNTLLDYRYNYTVACMNFGLINFTPDNLHYGQNPITQVTDGTLLQADQNRYPIRARATAPTQFTHILASNFDIKDYDGNIIYYNSERKPPELATEMTALETLDFEYLAVNSWGYSDTDFYMLIYDRTYTGVDPEFALTPTREILINHTSPYYKQTLSANPSANSVYYIPVSEMGVQFRQGGAYEIRFGIKNQYETGGRRTADGGRWTWWK